MCFSQLASVSVSLDPTARKKSQSYLRRLPEHRVPTRRGAEVVGGGDRGQYDKLPGLPKHNRGGRRERGSTSCV